jgi:ADP-heptose:LPS heptosyltransferase
LDLAAPSPPGALAALQPRSVAVFRALQLGDMLCAVPALRALRAALPRARITLIGLPWASSYAARFARYIDDFLGFPGYPGLPEQPPNEPAWPAFLAAARSRAFDLAIQLHGDGSRTNALVAQLGARMRAGFGAPTMGGLFLRYRDAGSEPARLLRLLRHLGAPSVDEGLEFPLTPADEAEWQPWPELHALVPGRYICIHAGARDAARRWPAAHFAAVADALARSSGLPIVLTGSAQEAALTRAVARAMHAPALDAAAPVSIGALGALIARSRLLVGNDTGTSHLAAALRVPSVTVFRASDIDRWAPRDRRRHRVVDDPAAARIDDVIRAAQELLQPPR